MKQWWRGALVGLFAYLVFVVLAAPAEKVLPLVQARLGNIQFAGLEGSLWSGKAAQVAVQPLQLRDVNWHLRPFGLFMGRVVFGVRAQLQQQAIKARLGSTFLGKPYLSSVRGRVSASDLSYWLGLTQLQLDGSVDFDIDYVEWPDSGLPGLAGRAIWSSARVVAPLELALGVAQLDTRIEGTATRGELQASGGALLVQADVELKPDGAYRLDANIQQKGELPQAVSKFLSTFAEYQDGNYRLEWTDKL